MKAILILFLTALVVLFTGLTGRRDMLKGITLAGLLLALGVTLMDLLGGDAGNQDTLYANMFVFDSYALAFSAVVLLTLTLIVGLSGWSFRQLNETLGDHYGLMLFSACGALVMVSFTNLTMLFLGIEILSIPLYVLAGSRRRSMDSNEAALKYFLMGAFATGILLYGFTLVYGATGSFDVATIAEKVRIATERKNMLHIGILMIIVGLSFKISAVPFHFWAPDVYTGSPTLVTAFMATVVKTAGFAAFYRLFAGAFGDAAGFWGIALSAIAALTMTLANTTAIFQQDFKRMMAYSSIAHAGYLLMGVLSIGSASGGGDQAILYYTLVYSVATVVAFAVYMVVSEQNQDNTFLAFRGLGHKQPALAALMVLSMLTLAGIPPTAGFFGKYMLFVSAFEQYTWLVVLAVINSAISIYYYFKVIVEMYFTQEENAYSASMPKGYQWALWVGVLLMAVLAVWPGLVSILVG